MPHITNIHSNNYGEVGRLAQAWEKCEWLCVLMYMTTAVQEDLCNGESGSD